MISTKNYVDKKLRKYNLVANKALGQNFLVEENIAREIVNSIDLDKNTAVIEVGPGLGALSEIILEHDCHLYSYEIDKNMVDILKETFKDNSNFEVTNIDFLKVDMEQVVNNIKKNGQSKIVFMSNLPYYITSKLLSKIVTSNLDIDNIVVMMQKEVGQKLIKPEKKDTNQLYYLLKLNYDSSIVKYVGKNSYLPRPEIDSIVLKYTKKDKVEDVDFNKFSTLLNAMFQNRRKTIYNNLKSICENDKIDSILNECNIDKNAHIEQITYEQIIKISKLL